MSDRVAACGAPLYAGASGADDEPPQPGPAPDTSRGSPSVADCQLYRCSAPEPYEFAPQRSEFVVLGAMPTFHYKTASAPSDASCDDYEFTQVLNHRLSNFRDRTEVEDQNEARGGTHVSEHTGSDREAHSDESQNCNDGINYQFLEQNISHQSILNQSISILNRQVSGRNGVSVNSVQQLVRTANGAVVAVVPTEFERETANEITVPLGWKRIISGSSVVYISPSGCALGAQAQLRDYLQTPGTCKCGLQCPLRPESAFSFDPKVASKPYQLPLGGDLTKLCNHKRKLLATLSATQPPTPPPASHQLSQHTQPDLLRKGMAVEVGGVGVLKKKAKKKTTLQPGVSVSQLLAQRERAQQGWMPQQEVSLEMMSQGTPTMSPHSIPVRNSSQSCPPAINMMPPNMSAESDHSPNIPGSHYLTVNPIHPAQRVVPEYQNTPMAGGCPNVNIGQPVLGTNGQIIGVHTGGVKLDGQMRNMAFTQQMKERKQEEDRLKSGEHNNQQTMVRQNGKPSHAGVNTAGHINMFCGLNQVPPEVVQKIDQQQQIFIQQNQKQIQMAMKGIRTHTAPDNSSHIKNIYQSQQIPPGQLVIQNGAVMKANLSSVNPGKTPPWQVKRTDTSPGPASAQHTLNTNPSPMYKSVSNETEDPNEPVIEAGDNYNLLQNFEQNMQMMQVRAPPVHMNYQQSVFPNETKKKTKQSPNKIKKKINVIESRTLSFSSNGLKERQDAKTNPYSNPSPSFMDDPSGYLAQQTALLNSTISRQVGSSATFERRGAQVASSGMTATNHNLSNQNISSQITHQGIQHRNIPHRFVQNSMMNEAIQHQNLQSQGQPFHKTANMANQANPHHMSNMDAPNSAANSLIPSDVRIQQTKGIEIQKFKNPVQQNISPPQNIPDSSMLLEKLTESALSQCCQGCAHSGNLNNSDNHLAVDMRNELNRKNLIYHENVCKMESDGHSSNSSPNHGIDDNPVTSSTYIERAGSHGGCLLSDNRGPIQGGTVSTSRVSPLDQTSLPEPSPTLSNSSRCTETPHSNPFAVPSPARSNPTTPTPAQFGSPGTPNHAINMMPSQMMNFISNHNVNRNLMDVDNISFTGANAIVKGSVAGVPQRNEQRRPTGNSMLLPGYCPPPHLGGGPSHSLSQTNYVQSLVNTMESGHTVIRDTITSVLAGKAHTATTSINRASTNMGRPLHPPNLANSYAIPPNHPDPFLNTVNLPTSYPLHIAGSVTQNIINRTPLEMVQNVVSNIPMSRQEVNVGQSSTVPGHTGSRSHVHSGQILISSTGQIIVPNQNSPMPPPAPKSQNQSGTSPSQSSSIVTNVSASVTQVIPAVGGVQQVINQPAVLVNTLPAPFVLQPQMMAVDGQVVQQNAVLPQIVTIPQGQSSNEPGDTKSGMIQRVTMLSPESSKKKGKKRKSHNLTNVLHIAAPQQNAGGVLLHHTSPQHHTSQQFSPRGFQLSPNSMSSAPMLQALTIVPGKSGTPAHIVMNGQGVTNNFGSQQIITNTSPTQQINLLQPVNLINNGNGVVPNFQTFQQFIVPNIGGMVMTADGTAIIQDSSTGMPMQLQLQNVNGQNVLTPIQNQNVIGGGNTGVVIRTQNQHGKIIQSQHSPGAQFLSPNGHIMMNSPTFSGQLSPLIANVSPTNVSFTSPHQVRSANVQQQDLMQCNQMGQTMMVPLSPKTTATGANRNGSTFVQQNTTIVQHQTTLVSNNTSNNISHNVTGSGNRLSIDPAVLFNHNSKHKTRSISIESPPENVLNSPGLYLSEKTPVNCSPTNRYEEHYMVDIEAKCASDITDGFHQLLGQQGGLSGHVRHSVSTQTLANQQRRSPPVPVYSSSPPDTTTHSPLGPLEHVSGSPRVYGARSVSMQGNYADTTTKSPEPVDSNSSAMVQCVSSSEPDVPESRECGWLPSPAHAAPHAPTPSAADVTAHHTPIGTMGGHCGHSGAGRDQRTLCSVESSDNRYSQTISVTSLNNQHSLTITPTGYCDRPGKRKAHVNRHFRSDKIVRTDYVMQQEHNKETQHIDEFSNEQSRKTDDSHFLQYNNLGNELQIENYDMCNSQANEDNAEGPSVQVHPDSEESAPSASGERKTREFMAGDLVWGPAKGYPWWPGKLVSQKDGGAWLVRWFGGDKSTSALEPGGLLTLTEGLEANHAARTKCRKSRKLNSQLEKAIQEAMSELDKRTGAEPSSGGAGGKRGGRGREGRATRAAAARSHREPVKIAPAVPSHAPVRLRSNR